MSSQVHDMIFFPFFLWINLILVVRSQVYECPNYQLITRKYDKKPAEKSKKIRCNRLMINPKKVINPYKTEMENYVQSKPFGSICLKCSMCLAISKEMDRVFKGIVDKNKEEKQTIVVDLLKENIRLLCETGFENYDLRKFKEYQIVTDDFACSTHVRTKMDGQWTEKLREMCTTYYNHMDVQSLLNDYLKEIPHLPNYLCSNNGVFRDCSSLNFKNTSINQEQNIESKIC